MLIDSLPRHSPAADHLPRVAPGLIHILRHIGPDSDMESDNLIGRRFGSLPVDVGPPPVNIGDRAFIAAQEVIRHDVRCIRQCDPTQRCRIINRKLIPTPETLRHR
ncbi:MAG: hypothetical protein DYH02_04245 [Candidatus Omnitrophica bacterium COP1]|nr:hypothetical protein [Candidatus Omnitrophica bacterium COP1]